jgi:hypothetical protein
MSVLHDPSPTDWSRSRRSVHQEGDVNTKHYHNGWFAAAAALSAIALPVGTSAAENGKFEQLSVYLERNIQDKDAEIKFEVTGASDGLTAASEKSSTSKLPTQNWECAS